MLNKEIHDTLRILGFSLLVGLFIVVFSYVLINMSTEDGISFNELLCTTIELMLLGLSLIAGASLFFSEKETNSFEYLLSLKLSRIKILIYKLLPRFLVLLALFLSYLLFKGFLASHPLLLEKVFILLFFSLFFLSVSLSLIHKNSILTIIFNMLFYVILALPVVFLLYIMNGFGFERSELGFLNGLAFLTVFVLIFVFFVLNFRKVDLGNLFTLFYKKGLVKFFGILWGITIVFILFNQVDSGKNPNLFTIKDLYPVTFDKDNGYYRLLTLFEHEGVDVESDAIHDKYRKINDPQYAFNGYNYYKTIRRQTKKNLQAIKGEKLINLQPPYRTGNWCQFFKKKEELIIQEKDKLSLVLDRYMALIDSERVDDFTRIDIWAPTPQLLAWKKTGELFLAVNMLESMNGNWQQGVTRIIDHIIFLKKMIKSSRVMITNLIAKSIMNNSIIGLANMLNMPNCPKQIYEDILEKLEPLSYEEYGSKNSFIGEYLAASMELDQWKRGFKTGSLHEYLLGLFIQKNRTKKIIYNYCSQLLKYERKPPYQWENRDKYQVARRNSQITSGWFWWFHNPGGKYIARSLMMSPFLILRSNQTKSLYDMLLISAELHLNWNTSRSIEEALAGLKTYQNLLDPGSGKPYGYDKKREFLYSVGMDGVEDDAKDEKVVSFGSDFVLPLILDNK